ncbi:unnamed protein product [Clavelina lepadiformis]|uniref:G-protein coupled receptors family 1 profile domain-containing protein n=1 Tax=Clavelina lepadiformis TaxID=159417 RepID=A0ABP0GBH6_CLALP
MLSNMTNNGGMVSLETGPAELITVSYEFERVPCQQDKATAGSLEVMASTAGTVIGITNLFTIMAVLGSRKKPKSTQTTFYYICNLAVADMLAGFLLLWIFCLQEVVLPFRTPISELLQKSVWIVTVWSSMLSQVMIAVDRYFHICSVITTENIKRRKRLLKWGIAITWLMPILMFVVPVVTKWNCLIDCFCQKPVNSTSDVYYMICKPLGECSQFNPPFTKSSMFYLGFVLLLMPVIPCVLYAKIYYLSRKMTLKSMGNRNRPSFGSTSTSTNQKERTIKETCLSNRDEVAATPSLGAKTSTHQSVSVWFKQRNGHHMNADECKAQTQERRRSKREKKRDKKDLKLLHTLVIILVLFLISTIPLGVLFLVSFDEVDKRYVKVVKILLMLSLLNSLLNPSVYFWRFPTMRQAFCRVFRCRRKSSINSRKESSNTKVEELA